MNDSRSPSARNRLAARILRRESLVNWLALLMLLAVGIVWPPGG